MDVDNVNIIRQNSSMEEKPYHHPDLRKKLLDTALKLIRKEGIGGFSMRELASAAGVSHAAPYRHFRNKDEIVSCILLEGHRKLKRELEEARLSRPGDPMAALLALGRAYLDFAARNPEHLRAMFTREGLSSAAKSDCLDSHADEYDSFGVLEDAMREARDGGSIESDEDIGLLSLSIWSELHGLAILRNEGLIGLMAGDRGMKEPDAMSALLRLIGHRWFKR
jgi:AcrR family transcriptional regulator